MAKGKNIGKSLRKAGKQTQKALKKAHVGQMLMDAAVAGAMAQGGMSTGMGAYGRGAYGRGSYAKAKGQGEYEQVKVNSLFNEYAERRHKVLSANDETGSIKTSRREYVMRVTSAGAGFNNTSFAINPGLSGVFAWLSQQAINYDEYKLDHLVFHYKPVVSQASQSGAMGSILLSCNYNAGAVKFASFREMAEYSGTLETRVCDEALFGVECDPKKNVSSELFIRAGDVPDGQDVKTYDLGTFQLATSDINTTAFPSGTLLGHLYVEYDVVLAKPKLYSALGKAILMDSYISNVGVDTDHSFGTTVVASTGNLLGATLEGNVITFPPNFYGSVVVVYTCAATSSTMAAPTFAGNVTGYKFFDLKATAYNIVGSGTGEATIMMAVAVTAADVATSANTITLANTVSGSANMNLMITQVNPDVE
jgi:hypothetical protein